MTGYALDNSWDEAKRRLALLELYLDPKTKRRTMRSVWRGVGVARRLGLAAQSLYGSASKSERRERLSRRISIQGCSKN